MNPGEYLRIEGLRIVAAKGTPLVNGVSLAARLGETLGVIGESGSGKSLTCQAVMGLLPPGLSATGAVVLGGRPMPLSGGAASRLLRRGLAAMILQNPMSCFDPVFTIKAHFKETLAAQGVPRAENRRERWEAALGEAGFADPGKILPLFPFQMSGGMLQRVMIALAIVMRAPFLIADEATTDLDAASQARALDLLERLRETRGMGILLITHDLSVIARLADRVCVMRQGRILEQRNVYELFEAPKHPYVQALMRAHYRLYGKSGAPGRRGAAS